MIRVTIQMVPNGDETKTRLLGTILITNDGTGNENYGNYEAAISHTGKYLGVAKEPYQTSRVEKFKRTSSVYNLIAQVLAKAKFYKHQKGK